MGLGFTAAQIHGSGCKGFRDLGIGVSIACDSVVGIERCHWKDVWSCLLSGESLDSEARMTFRKDKIKTVNPKPETLTQCFLGSIAGHGVVKHGAETSPNLTRSLKS